MRDLPSPNLQLSRGCRCGCRCACVHTCMCGMCVHVHALRIPAAALEKGSGVKTWFRSWGPAGPSPEPYCRSRPWGMARARASSPRPLFIIPPSSRPSRSSYAQGLMFSLGLARAGSIPVLRAPASLQSHQTGMLRRWLFKSTALSSRS